MLSFVVGLHDAFLVFHLYSEHIAPFLLAFYVLWDLQLVAAPPDCMDPPDVVMSRPSKINTTFI